MVSLRRSEPVELSNHAMVAKLISILAGWIIAIISALGYGGIVLCMAIESACIPLPSEIIMPFAGYLVFKGEMTLWGIALAGGGGCVLGSVVAYYAGLYLGRDFVIRYGKYVLVSRKDLELAERWFDRYGQVAIFFSRLLPVVRTFISFPAGVAKMKMAPFIVYTFVGSFLWCYGLGWVGIKMGEKWDTIGKYFHQFDIAIGILILLGAAFWIKHHFAAEKTA